MRDRGSSDAAGPRAPRLTPRHQDTKARPRSEIDRGGAGSRTARENSSRSQESPIVSPFAHRTDRLAPVLRPWSGLCALAPWCKSARGPRAPGLTPGHQDTKARPRSEIDRGRACSRTARDSSSRSQEGPIASPCAHRTDRLAPVLRPWSGLGALAPWCKSARGPRANRRAQVSGLGVDPGFGGT
jgi:hypothetical protein